MILKVAWRNIWRNKVRSLVVIIAIAIGLWAGAFASAFVTGMMEQKILNVIRLEMSHLQFHHPEFLDEYKTSLTIPNGKEVIEEIKNKEMVQGVAPRVLTMSMLGSANKSGAIRVLGVDPETEQSVTDIHSVMTEGKYFEGVSRNPIVISSKTAADFKLKIRSKVVLTVTDTDREIISGAFRVCGIYNSGNPIYDEMNAFVRIEDLRPMLGIEDEIHEIAVLLNDHELADPVTESLQEQYSEVEVKSWMDLASGMRYMVEAKDTYTVVIIAIILIALLFSIVNTMLMAVMERIKEIGMLMAVGMSKAKVFRMIMFETLFLTLIGAPIGLLISWLCISYFGDTGINLGEAAYGDLGFGTIVFPELSPQSYVTMTIMVAIMSIIAALYPARKALKLNPAEAIRKI